MRLHVLELPADRLRALESTTKETAECGRELKQLLSEAANKGSVVKVIADVPFAPPSGRNVTYQNATEHSVCETIHFDMRKRVSVPFAHRLAGLVAELSTTLGPDKSTIDVNCRLLLHPLPPSQRMVTVTEVTSQEEASFPVAEMVLKELTFSTTLSSGMTKLIGTLQPIAGEKRLWAVFLHVSAVPVSPAGIVPRSREQDLNTRMLRVRRAAHPDLFLRDEDVGSARKMPIRKVLIQEGIPLTQDEKVIVDEGMLEIEASPETVERIDHLLWGLREDSPKSTRMLLQLVEAPWPLLHAISRECGGVFDHAASWKKLEGALEDRTARLADLQWIEGKHHDDARIKTGRDHGFIDGLNLAPDGRPNLLLKRRHIGTSFGFGLLKDSSEDQVSLSFMPAPEIRRRAVFRDSGAMRTFDLPMTDFHIAHSEADFYVSTNHTRLLGIWQPEGREELLKAGKGIAAFVHQDIVFPHAGRKAKPKPSVKPKAAPNPDAWETRIFRVPPDFLSTSGPSESERPKAADILKGAGIPFPEGATARLDGTLLTVKNTNANLEIIQFYVDEINKNGPKAVVLTAHLAELPPAKAQHLLKACREEADHGKWLQQVIDWSQEGIGKTLASMRVETKGGYKAISKEVKERIHVTELGISDQGVPRLTTERRETGTVLEIEPTVGPDGETVELSVTFHHELEPPQEHAEQITDAGTGKAIRVPLTDFHQVELSTGLTMLNGSCRVIGAWKSHTDAIQILFVSCDVVSLIP